MCVGKLRQTVSANGGLSPFVPPLASGRLIWKLLTVVGERFRKLNAAHLLEDVFEGGKTVSPQ